jgi:RNA polymerase sigma factor (sigma-70 family)
MADDRTDVTDVVARAQDGDKDAWDEIVVRFAPVVWHTCRAHRLSIEDSKDVGQTVWLSLVENLPRIRQPAALPGWLATTTRNECLRVVRRRRAQAQREEQADLDLIALQDLEASPDTRLLNGERDAVLRAAFAQLAPRCQELLYLLTRDPPLSYAEIGGRLKMPVGAIGPNRGRCLDRLRQCPILVTWLRADGEPEGTEEP